MRDEGFRLSTMCEHVGSHTFIFVNINSKSLIPHECAYRYTAVIVMLYIYYIYYI